MTIEEIKDMMSRATDEYIVNNGNLTTEFSAKGSQVLDILGIIQELNKRFPVDIPSLEKAHWRLFKCDVCQEYNSVNIYHVEIFNF